MFGIWGDDRTATPIVSLPEPVGGKPYRCLSLACDQRKRGYALSGPGGLPTHAGGNITPTEVVDILPATPADPSSSTTSGSTGFDLSSLHIDIQNPLLWAAGIAAYFLFFKRR
jgi:hypothetical protein